MELKLIKSSKEIPFFILKVESHETLKPLILQSISDMKTNSINTQGIKISNTDWNLQQDIYRPYSKFILPIIDDICEKVNKKFNFSNSKIKFINCWFQQYEYLDFHSWHEHIVSDGIGSVVFSCVYYLELENNNPKTTFKIFDEEFEFFINEGEILIFPSFITHCSKPNHSKKRKTIISFNLG